MKRVPVLVTLVAMLLSLGATPVLADHAPPNDTYDGRIAISALPYSADVDTTHATTDALDLEVSADCTPPALDASVWYELTLDADQAVHVELIADYSVGIVVATGGPGSFETTACQPGSVVFDAFAGVPYTIMVFDDQTDGQGNGGILTISAAEPPPPPEVELEIGETGTLNPLTGTASIEVTVTCSEDVLAELSASVTQQIGQHTVLGGGGSAVECGPVPVTTAIEVIGQSSSFNPGTLSVHVEAFACSVQCGSSFAEAEVRLRPAPSQPEEPPAPPEPPANDEPDGALPIGLDETVTQDTSTATASEADPFDCAVEPVPPSGATVWYAFTAPADGFFVATTEGSDYDTVAFVIAPDGSVAGCDDDLVLGTGSYSEAIFEGTAGVTYLVMAGSYGFGAGGLLTLTVTTSEVGPPPPPPPPDGEPPANDDRSSPTSIVVGDTLEPLDTTAATIGADDALPSCTAPGGATVWYAFEALTTGWVEVTTDGSDYDTMLVVLAGGEEVACNDDTSAGSLQARATFHAEEGVTYEIMAGSFGGGPGGSLVVSLLTSEAPLTVEVTEASASLDPRTGAITLTGTVTCSEEASAELFAGAEQQNGRFGVFGEGGTFVESCSPDGSRFEISIVGNEAYRPGEAFISGFAVAFNEGGDAFTGFEVATHLAPSRPGR